MSNKKGFTLIELIAVMAIISILISIAIMQYNRYLRKTGMESQTRTMLNDLMIARSNATYQHREKRVRLTPTTFSVYSINDDGSETQVLDKNLTYSITYNGTGIFDFDSQGFSSVGNGNASICIEPSGNEARVDSVVVFSTLMHAGKRQEGGDCKSANIDYE